MLVRREHKIRVSYQEIFKKGTLTLLTTFGAGALFGKKNMMIAFVLALGSNALAAQNLKIKTFYKALRLILIDTLIVCVAYLTSLNKWLAIPINLIAIFAIIYLTVSLYDQGAHKTFLMLYIFCQYNNVTWLELPSRIAMIVFSVSVIVAVIFLEQSQIKALLPPQIGKALGLIEKQLDLMQKGEGDKHIGDEISYQMNELAYVIYGSSFYRYFTTLIGKVNFHFYLNISYLNFLLVQMNKPSIRALFTTQEIRDMHYLFKSVQSYFKRQITRTELLSAFKVHLEEHPKGEGFKAELWESLFSLKKNFKELDEVPHRKKHQVYEGWEHSQLRHMRHTIEQYLRPQKMRFNFATRMAIILSIGLFCAEVLGFYKFIWAIIPIMSITQPYLEDTKKRRLDRLESNIIAAVVVTIVLNLIRVEWFTITLLIVAFYLYYAYKDYYHISFFLTVISMCFSTVNAGINTLFFYRVLYVLIGVATVGITSYLKPYRLEDGIKELMKEIKYINQELERESVLVSQGEGNLNAIREMIIYSAVLCQKLYLRNKQYQDETVTELIHRNMEFIAKLGYGILRNE